MIANTLIQVREQVVLNLNHLIRFQCCALWTFHNFYSHHSSATHRYPQRYPQRLEWSIFAYTKWKQPLHSMCAVTRWRRCSHYTGGHSTKIGK